MWSAITTSNNFFSVLYPCLYSDCSISIAFLCYILIVFWLFNSIWNFHCISVLYINCILIVQFDQELLFHFCAIYWFYSDCSIWSGISISFFCYTMIIFWLFNSIRNLHCISVLYCECILIVQFDQELLFHFCSILWLYSDCSIRSGISIAFLCFIVIIFSLFTSIRNFHCISVLYCVYILIVQFDQEFPLHLNAILWLYSDCSIRSAITISFFCYTMIIFWLFNSIRNLHCISVLYCDCILIVQFDQEFPLHFCANCLCLLIVQFDQEFPLHFCAKICLYSDCSIWSGITTYFFDVL